MSKKFSTLMASLLLASAFSANAEETDAQKLMNVSVDQLISGRQYQIWTADGDSVLTIGETGNTANKYKGPLFVKAEGATPGTLVVAKSNGTLTFADPLSKNPVYLWDANDGDSCLYSYDGRAAIALTPVEATKGYKLTAKVGDETLDVNSWGAAWTLKVNKTVNSGASEEIKAQSYIFKALDENSAAIPEYAEEANWNTKQNVYLVVDGKYIGVKATQTRAAVDGSALETSENPPAADATNYLWIHEDNGLRAYGTDQYLGVNNDGKLTLQSGGSAVDLSYDVLTVGGTTIGYAAVLETETPLEFERANNVNSLTSGTMDAGDDFIIVGHGKVLEEGSDKNAKFADYVEGNSAQLWTLVVEAEGPSSYVAKFKNVKTGRYLSVDGTYVTLYNVTAMGNNGNLMATFDGDEGFCLQLGDTKLANANLKGTDVIGQAVTFKLSTQSEIELSAAELNYFEKDGFSVTIKGYDKNHKPTVDLKNNYFTGHLTPMVLKNDGSGFKEATDEKTFYLQNEDGNFIVANSKLAEGTDIAYALKVVDASTLLRDIARTENLYYGQFTFKYSDAVASTTQLENIDEILVKNYRGIEVGKLGRLNWKNTEYYLAVQPSGNNQIALDEISIKLGGDQIVDWTKVISANFFTVKDASKLAAGYLTATGFGNVDASFSKAARNVLETQWALKHDGDSYVFSNRENPAVTFTISDRMYTTSAENTYRVDGYTLTIEPVESVTSRDGYKDLGDVRNQKFNIGYWSTVYNTNAWLTENHTTSAAHPMGLTINKEEALTWTAQVYDGKATHTENTAYEDVYTKSDSIYVVSKLAYYNAKKNAQEFVEDTLKVVSYSFVNEYGEPLQYDGAKYIALPVAKIPAGNTAQQVADKFVLREADDHVILRPFTMSTSAAVEANFPEAQTFKVNGTDIWKMYAGDTKDGLLIKQNMWDGKQNDLFDVTATDVPMYRKVAKDLDVIAIHRDSNDKETLYESNGFLGLDNTVQFDKIAPAMIADTGMVSNTYRPTYLLAVGAKVTPAGKYCPVHGADADCKDEHLLDIPGWVTGRYLVNLKDTAIAWDAANKHKEGNPYTNTEKLYRLGFVKATHINDTLAIAATKPAAKDSIYVGDGALTAATFAFRYVDQAAGSFVIETADFHQIGTMDGAINISGARKNSDGYIKWMNGVVVVVPEMKDADIFNMAENYEGEPTANEAIEAAGVQVIGGKGAVTVQGAAGKVITVANILGQTIANQVAASDNVTIAVPAGIVVVAVEGEATKVVVK